MELEQLIKYFSLGVVVLWTVRQSRAKGQNPWLWGGASILLMIVPGLQFLGIAPMVCLLFFPRTAQAPTVNSKNGTPEDRVICPKCQAYHATGHNFCVNCGWQLDQPYAPEGATPPVSSAEDLTKVEQPQAAASLASEESTEVIPTDQDVAETGASATVIASEQASTVAATADSQEEQRVEPAPAAPPPKPAFRFPLTAAGFTDRGISLFTEDRVQEAVDQFTKAIALDPDYRPAWTKRAEAYLRLGLSQKAEEDQRRLEGI